MDKRQAPYRITTKIPFIPATQLNNHELNIQLKRKAPAHTREKKHTDAKSHRDTYTRTGGRLLHHNIFLFEQRP